MLEIEIELFKKYVNNYDMNESAISRKYYHSFRVMDYCIEIAKSLNLNEEDIYLAGLIGLLHDIGRFEQHKIYGTYIDFKSIDHGDFGASILEKDNYINQYIEDKQKRYIVLKAVKNHNKFSIEEGLDEKTVLFCKIIRDADKIDIMEQQGNKTIDEGVFGSDETIESIFRGKQSKNTTVLNDADIVLRLLCFIFDFNFKYTFKHILDINIISEKIKYLEGHISEKYNLNEIEDVLINYVKERI